MPTMNDVAARAGVSKSRGSRVINDQPGVAPPIREQVLKAVEELGYRPNQQARSLRTARTHMLGPEWRPRSASKSSRPSRSLAIAPTNRPAVCARRARIRRALAPSLLPRVRTGRRSVAG